MACSVTRCACVPVPTNTSSTGGTGSTGSSGSDSGSTGTTGHELDGGLDIDGGGAYHAAPLNPTVYWCAVLDGGLTQADGGGCEPQLPACAGTALPLEYAIHVAEPTPVIYDATYPPASGPHWPCWEAWGPTHALLPPMRFVHNLEHGGVVFVVQCLADAGPTDCESRLQPASDFATADGPVAPLGDRRYVVLPSFEATHAYTALAWGWRLELDAWDRDVFACFASAHLGQGPENFAVDPDLNACPQSFQP